MAVGALPVLTHFSSHPTLINRCPFVRLASCGTTSTVLLQAREERGMLRSRWSELSGVAGREGPGSWTLRMLRWLARGRRAMRSPAGPGRRTLRMLRGGSGRSWTAASRQARAWAGQGAIEGRRGKAAEGFSDVALWTPAGAPKRGDHPVDRANAKVCKAHEDKQLRQIAWTAWDMARGVEFCCAAHRRACCALLPRFADARRAWRRLCSFRRLHFVARFLVAMPGKLP
jgi:hypothetical protein